MQGGRLALAIQEELTPLDLAHPDIVINPEMYKRLKKFLESRGIPCLQTEMSGRLIPRRITVTLFAESEETECRRALRIYDAAKRGEDIILSPRSPSQTHAPFHQTTPESPSHRGEYRHESIKAKLSQVFATNFRNNSDEFSGAVKENWPRFLSAFQQVCAESEVRTRDKLQFLRHILRVEALEFYYNQIIDKNEKHWGADVALLNDAFSSEAKMDAVTEKLRSVSLQDYEDNERTERQALKELTKTLKTGTYGTHSVAHRFCKKDVLRECRER